MQLAEAAARVEPEVSARSYTAGRLCRRMGDHARSALWYNRALRLARRARKERRRETEVDYANARLGLGNLELDLGRFEQAEAHYWKAVRAAMRIKRKSLAAAAHHNLLLLMIDLDRMPKAVEHAQRAVRLYPSGHPRFPFLAHDVAFLWLRQGYFSSAFLILEKLLPWVERKRDRIGVLASIARCAAAVKDHIRYERASAEVIAIAAVDDEMADSSLYHVAEGARSFWEWERAEQLARRALQLAEQRKNSPLAVLIHSLLADIATCRRGDVDRVPTESDEIETMTFAVLNKLRKQPAPGGCTGAVPPERFPTE